MNDRISTGLAGLNGRPHALYRFFDRSDVLLYVGITIDIGARFKKHQAEKSWWAEVEHIGIEHYDTRREALDAESRAILTEQPLYNVAQNQFAAAPEDAAVELARELLDECFEVGPDSEAYKSALREAEGDAEALGYTLNHPDIEVVRAIALERSMDRATFLDAVGELLEAAGEDRVTDYFRMANRRIKEIGLDVQRELENPTYMYAVFHQAVKDFRRALDAGEA